MSFRTGDLVWARMKGYAPWPAKISEPSSTKRKNMQWCFFFGTHNFAWIENSQIQPYMKYRNVLNTGSKMLSFKKSVKEVENYIATEGVSGMEQDDETFFEMTQISEPVTSTPVQPKGQKRKNKSSGRKSLNQSSNTPNSVPAKRARKEIDTRIDTSTENGSFLEKSTLAKELVEDDLLNSTPTESVSVIGEHARNFSKCLGVLGLGNIGSQIVRDLLNAGYILNIWSRTTKKCDDMLSFAESQNKQLQLTVRSTPSEVFRNSDIIFSCLNDEKTVNKIIDKVFEESLDEDLEYKGYVEMTSIPPDSAKEMDLKFKEKKCKYLLAQIQNSKMFLCSGDMELFKQCEACLVQTNAKLKLCSDFKGITTNLLLQLIKGVTLAGLAEAFALAEHCGISETDLLTIFSYTQCCNNYLLDKARIIVKRTFKENIQHSVALMQKDMDLVIEIADNLKQPSMMASKANELYKQARNFGDENEMDASCVYLRKKMSYRNTNSK